MIYQHVLGGCTPTPLAHYLKALGIQRLVAEQKDPQTAGCWRTELFVLHTKLSRQELDRFFLEEYRPTPIIAPWNRGSGFYPRDNKNGIQAITGSAALRFQSFREVIELVFKEIEGMLESPKEEEKALFLLRMRSRLPDFALPWFDAAVMLLSDRPGYPPLLGTGGNDGRLDFTNNFMQRLVEIIDPSNGTPTENASRWLEGALYGVPIDGLVSHAIGQFSPGSAGGPNSTVGFGSESCMNPWDFVLMLEGALLFAGAATRRLAGADVAGMSYPLTVKTTGAGSGCGSIADENPSRAEIWLPLWKNAIGLAEMKFLFSEGRVTLGKRPVRDGLEFVRALGGYGTDRGITAFQRFGLLMRSGKAYLATPLGRVRVQRNPQSDLINQLDRNQWLYRLRAFARSDNAPGRLQQLVRRLEDAIFAHTQFGRSHELQQILILIAALQQTCSVSTKGRDAVSPLSILDSEWAVQADDQTHEFRIACALAGLLDMRSHLLPIQNSKGKVQWEPNSHQAVWKGGDLIVNLVRVLNRRLLDARRVGQDGREGNPFAGIYATDLSAVTAFMLGETNDTLIAALLAGLINVELPHSLPKRPALHETPPGAYTVLKPLFTSEALLRSIGVLPAADHLSLPGEMVPLLASGQIARMERAMAIAWRRLYALQLRLPSHPRRPPAAINLDGARLAAALMVPLAIGELVRVFECFENIS